jgi:hypothetical protein
MAEDPERDVADAGQQARLALEAQATRELVDGQQLAAALDLIEEAIPQVSLRTLAVVQPRLARAATRARARLERGR